MFNQHVSRVSDTIQSIGVYMTYEYIFYGKIKSGVHIEVCSVRQENKQRWTWQQLLARNYSDRQIHTSSL